MGTDSRSLIILLVVSLLYVVRLWGELVCRATVGKRRLRCELILFQVVGDPPTPPNMLKNLLLVREVSIDDFFAQGQSAMLDRLVGSDGTLADEVRPTVETKRLCQYRLRNEMRGHTHGLRSLSISTGQCREGKENGAFFAV